MAFRLRLPSKNTFGFPENRVADSRCDLPRFASRLDLVAKNDFRVSRKLVGWNPKIGLSHEASPKKQAGSVAAGACAVPDQRRVQTGSVAAGACAVPDQRRVASDLVLLATSHSSQEVQNFRPSDGHFAQIHSQACLAFDAPRLAVERSCASRLAAKSGHDMGPAKKWGRRAKIALRLAESSTEIRRIQNAADAKVAGEPMHSPPPLGTRGPVQC